MPASESRKKRRAAANQQDTDPTGGRTTPAGTEAPQATASASGTSNAGALDAATEAWRLGVKKRLEANQKTVAWLLDKMTEYGQHCKIIANHKDSQKLDERAAALKNRIESANQDLEEQMSAIDNKRATSPDDISQWRCATDALVSQSLKKLRVLVTDTRKFYEHFLKVSKEVAMQARRASHQKKSAADQRGKKQNQATGTAPSTSQTTASASGSSNAGPSDPLTGNRRTSAVNYLEMLGKKVKAANTSLTEYYEKRPMLANHRDTPELDRQAAELKMRLDSVDKKLQDRLSALKNNTACTEEDVTKCYQAVLPVVKPAKGFKAKFTKALLETQALQGSQNAGST